MYTSIHEYTQSTMHSIIKTKRFCDMFSVRCVKISTEHRYQFCLSLLKCLKSVVFCAKVFAPIKKKLYWSLALCVCVCVRTSACPCRQKYTYSMWVHQILHTVHCSQPNLLLSHLCLVTGFQLYRPRE